MNSPLPHPLVVVFFFNSHPFDLFALSPRSNLVPRAFLLKNGWEGKSPGDEVAHDLKAWNRLESLGRFDIMAFGASAN